MNRVDILIDNKEKFFSCFKKSSDCDCWNWERYKDKDGYGQFQFSHLKEKFIFVAHRASYEMYWGKFYSNSDQSDTKQSEGMVNLVAPTTIEGWRTLTYDNISSFKFEGKTYTIN